SSPPPAGRRGRSAPRARRRMPHRRSGDRRALRPDEAHGRRRRGIPAGDPPPPARSPSRAPRRGAPPPPPGPAARAPRSPAAPAPARAAVARPRPPRRREGVVFDLHGGPPPGPGPPEPAGQVHVQDVKPPRAEPEVAGLGVDNPLVPHPGLPHQPLVGPSR